MRRCRHRWVDQWAQFYPPRALKSVRVGDPEEDKETLLILLYGVTVAAQRRAHCGELGVRTLIGDHRDHLPNGLIPLEDE